ncbi:LuxR C-terminal-related transcriptional regulator [Frateuria sp. YIM B11624]|uniref:response regulator transcription factor n=1 Tax=Frateuria sp. YIM B11624 TaxID=3143185 RepID=UPI003C78DF8B
MIPIVLGGPDLVLRRLLASVVRRVDGLELRGEAATPLALQMLLASHRPTVLVLDARWVQAGSHLLGELLTRPASPRVLLHAASLDRPEILAAVMQGVHGCLPSDAHPALWAQAIQAVHAGEAWIPRGLMTQALACMRQWLSAPLLASAPMDQLTQRQHEIVRWVAQGLSNKEIGRHMGISPTTVKTHLHNIFERAGISGRQQLAVRALSPAPDEQAASRNMDDR